MREIYGAVREIINTPKVQIISAEYYYDGDQYTLDRVKKNFFDLEEPVNKEIRFMCETNCPDGLNAWVKPEGTIEGTFNKTIHICPCAEELADEELARTIFHELSHQYLGMEDYAYAFSLSASGAPVHEKSVWWKTPITGILYPVQLSLKERLNNVAIFANFIFYLYTYPVYYKKK